MVVGLVSLAHDHGPVAVIAVCATIKYAKYRIVRLRTNIVNEKVCNLTHSRFAALDEEDRNAKDSVCAGCTLPLWLRRDEDEYDVKLLECGCLMHSTCLMETAMRQCGISLPQSSADMEFGHVVAMARRLLGMDDVLVDRILCPSCGSSNSSWRRVKDEGEVVTNLVTAAAAASALHRGDTLCLGSLREALLCYGGAASPDFKRWRDAACSEQRFLELLQEQGVSAKMQLSSIFGPRRHDDPCWKGSGEIGRQLALASGSGETDDSEAEDQDKQVKQHAEDQVALRRSYADFLFVEISEPQF